MNGLLRVILKEFLHLRRDRQMIPVLLVGPIIQLLALGYAANMDVTDIPMVLVDQDRTAASRELVERFTGSGYFRLAGSEETVRNIDSYLVEGRAQVALVISAGYGDAVGAHRAPKVQVIADGSDSNSAILGLGYTSRIVSAASAERIRKELERLFELKGEKGFYELVRAVLMGKDFYKAELARGNMANIRLLNNYVEKSRESQAMAARRLYLNGDVNFRGFRAV